MYKELVKGYLEVKNRGYYCTKILLGTNVYSKVIDLVMKQCRFPLTEKEIEIKTWKCDYCKNVIQLISYKCPNCGAARGESSILINKNEVKFMQANLLPDYTIKEDEVVFVNEQNGSRHSITLKE